MQIKDGKPYAPFQRGFDTAVEGQGVYEVAPLAGVYLQNTVFIDETWDAITTAAIDYEVDLTGYERFAILFKNTITVVGGAPAMTFTFFMSYDSGTTYSPVGLTSLTDNDLEIASDTLLASANVIYRSPQGLPLGQLKITADPNATTDADDTVQVLAMLYAKKG